MIFALSLFLTVSIRVACSSMERSCNIRFGFADDEAVHDLLECLAFKTHIPGTLADVAPADEMDAYCPDFG